MENSEERFSRRVSFIDVVNFIVHHLKVHTDPVFGNIPNLWCEVFKEHYLMLSSHKDQITLAHSLDILC